MLIVLHHAGEVRADFHAGDDAAAVHAEWPDERAGPALERRLDHPRINHRAQRNAALQTAGRNDDGLARPDVDRLGALVDVAVAPEAFQALAALGIHPWRVARFHSQNPAREWHLPDQL